MRTRTSGGVGGAGVSPAPTRFLGAARAVAHDPSHAPSRRCVLRASRTSARPAVLARRNPGATPRWRPPSRSPPPIRPSSAPTRARRGDVTRRCPAGRDPTPARARRPRDHLHLPARDRQHRNPPHRPRTSRSNDPSHQRAQAHALTLPSDARHAPRRNADHLGTVSGRAERKRSRKTVQYELLGRSSFDPLRSVRDGRETAAFCFGAGPHYPEPGDRKVAKSDCAFATV